MTLKSLNIDRSWTLFLDRDGVLNKQIPDDYVKHYGEFEFLPGAKDCIAGLNNKFGKIIVVTNQQGIGKGLFTASELEGIHLSMLLDIILAGGQIDRIFYAPELESENSEMRKPNIGMAHAAKEAFPEIDFSKSIMAGDSVSDMLFGRKAGMKTVFLNKKFPEENDKALIDFSFSDLLAFSENL
ncbi:MAG: HAD-IIIA family hydrolase [Bacteroidia bacterium]|nr:HAD-IIIA family hydrolase [Bacteroidia bacterium]